MLHFPLELRSGVDDSVSGFTLGPLEPWQDELFLAHLSVVREYLRPFVPFASRVTDLGAARELLQKFADSMALDGARLYGIWLGGELVGGTMFRIFDPISKTCELGVWLDPAYAGRGIVSAAIRPMVDWAVQVRGIERVEWFCDVTNPRSRAVAERLGMTYEGTMRSLFELEGRRRDLEVWAILAPEWRRQRGLPG